MVPHQECSRRQERAPLLFSQVEGIGQQQDGILVGREDDLAFKVADGAHADAGPLRKPFLR